MTDLAYSIIIPAYNESERLTVSLPQIRAFLDAQSMQAEIIVVNDGSKDDTAEVVRRFARLHQDVRLLDNPGNRGKGYSVRNGVLNASGDVILFTDADLSSPIGEATKLLEAIGKGADVAIGSRWLQAELQTERQPWYRQLFGRLFNLALRMILGLKYRDTQCGFKAFTREAAHTVFTRQRIERWGFDPELLFLANKFGLRTTEVPVQWAHDHRSKISPLRDGMKMAVEMLSVRWNDVRGLYRQPAMVPIAVPLSTPAPVRTAK